MKEQQLENLQEKVQAQEVRILEAENEKRFVAERLKDVEDQLRRTKNELNKEIEGIVGKEEFDNFKKFAFKDKMINMAVAFTLGAAFKNVISSISNNIFMPFANYFITKTGNNWRETIWEPVDGMKLEVGVFAGAFFDFLLIAVILYIIYNKIARPILEEQDETRNKDSRAKDD